MQEFYGQSNGPLLIVHGGAGRQDPQGNRAVEATDELKRIAQSGIAQIAKVKDPLEVVVHCLQEMEKSSLFNCGYGSALQGDGEVRMTAALMNGEKQIFSGVINAQEIFHPSTLAFNLQNKESRVIAQPGTEKLINELKLPRQSPISPERKKQFEDERNRKQGFDTVGCIYLDKNGNLFSGTTTGGRGYEFPGRVSDVATVAGTFATKFAAVSATGVGEQIVEAALCARMETRVRDQMKIKDAAKKCLKEADELRHQYGWIGISKSGEWCCCSTTKTMTFAVANSEKVIEWSRF